MASDYIPENIPDGIPEDATITFDPRRSTAPTEWLVGQLNAIDGEEHASTIHLGPGSTPTPVALVPKAARFELQRVIGLGGIGEVWSAEQPVLRRTVAIKRLQSHFYEVGRTADQIAQLEAAFREEAFITALLDHPNIVPVHDLSNDEDGRPLLAMKLVEGKSWGSVLALDAATLPADEFLKKHLQVLLSAAQAVAFAHSRRVLHRDLKPSQVILGEFGEVYLMDWGIAVRLPYSNSAPVGSTPLPVDDSLASRSPAGTPAYMAPEQTEPSAERLGPWTDVYLLGGILMNILTGNAPHEAATSREAWKMAKEGRVAPLRPRRTDLEIPTELAEICSRALAPQPADRFQTAEDFVAALSAWITGASRKVESKALLESVESLLGSAQPSYQMHIECERRLMLATVNWPDNPKAPALSDRVAVEYAQLALRNGDQTLAQLEANKVRSATTRAELTRAIEKRAALMNRRESQRRGMIAAATILALLLAGGLVRYTLDQKRASRLIADQRDTAITAQYEASRQRTLAEIARTIAEVEQYHSGIGIAQANIIDGRPENALEILRERTPEKFRNWEWGYLYAIGQRDDAIISSFDNFHAEFSRDGTAIVVGTSTALTRWDLATLRLVWSTPLKGRIAWSASFSPDDRIIMATSMDGGVYQLDAVTGKILRRLVGHRDYLREGNFNPAGTRYATVGADRDVRIWDVESGKNLCTFHAAKNDIYTVRYSPDGSRLLTASFDKTVVEWNAETGEKIRTIGTFPDRLMGAVYSPDGKRIATASRDRIFRVFDALDGTQLLEIPAPEELPYDVQFSPDSTLLVTTDDSGRLRVWDATTGKLRGMVWVERQLFKVRFDTTGKRLVTASRTGIRLFSLERILADTPLLRPPAKDGSDIIAGRLSVYGVPPGRSRTWESAESAWTTPTGQTIAQINGKDYRIDSRWTATSPAGDLQIHLEAPAFGATVRRMNGEVTATLTDKDTIAARFSSDGRRAITAQLADRIDVWDTLTFKKIASVRKTPTFDTDKKPLLRYDINAVDFTPDGKHFAVGFLNGSVEVFNTEDASPAALLREKVRVGLAVAFDSTGRLLASGGSDNLVYIWDWESGRLVSTCTGHPRTVIGSAFSPDGSRLVTFGLDMTVKLWDVASGREIMTLLEVESSERPLGAAFTPDGRTILVAQRGGRVQALKSLPWRTNVLPGNVAIPLRDRLEIYKREQRLGIISTDAEVAMPPSL